MRGRSDRVFLPHFQLKLGEKAGDTTLGTDINDAANAGFMRQGTMQGRGISCSLYRVHDSLGASDLSSQGEYVVGVQAMRRNTFGT